MKSDSPLEDTAASSERPRDFLRQIIAKDVQQGTHGGRVATRFPPEPNGFLHLGHAKSICLNFGIANEYETGQCHLRFDDTNPTTEDIRFVESIQRDIQWLGFDWKEHLYYASSYFETLYEWAVHLIREGKAYVCDLDEEAIRSHRGNLTEPGRPSPCRDRRVDENLALFEAMKRGDFEEGEKTLRAKIDLANPNMKMRDPLMYRIRKAHHFRTGNDWCIYPMYDYAHGLSDAIEGITHSFCTLEFENNRELYDWFVDHCPTPSKPRQYEFAKMRVSTIALGKRKLIRMVNEGVVDDWDDPRMPTLSGMRRKGFTPESLRNFCESVGVAKADNLVDIAQLEYFLREDLNTKSPRVMAVLDPLEVEITNLPEDHLEELEASYWPHDIPKEGTRKVPLTRTIFIERDDFRVDPPKGFRRLVPGGEVRLRYGYILRCDKVHKDPATQEVTKLEATLDLETLGSEGKREKKVKGVIHWVSATESVRREVHLFEPLFTVPEPDAEEDFLSVLNPNSVVKVTDCYLERSLAEAKPGDRFQFERKGYFRADPKAESGEEMVFFRTVSLKDSWARQKKKAEGSLPPKKSKASTKPPPKKSARPKDASGLDAAATARFEALTQTHGLKGEDARILAEKEFAYRLFEDSRQDGASEQGRANWILNEGLRLAGEEETFPEGLTGARLGSLVALVEAETVSGKTAKKVFQKMVEEGRDPEEIVRADGLEQISDPTTLGAWIDEVLEEHAEAAEKVRQGQHSVLGFLTGKALQKGKGRANPRLVQELLKQRFGD